MRVSELAKELGKSSKEVLDVLQKQGYGEKTHSSNVSDEQTQAIDVYKRQGLFLILCAIDHLHRTGAGGTAEQICVF